MRGSQKKTSQNRMVDITVALNGTDKNPYSRWGLKQNPFPQLGDAKYDAACLRLQKLGGDPIPNVEYIRETLKGFDPEFVELCCQNFKPGEYVRFRISWRSESPT